ncbi:hypothetical protein WA171_004678 [Blastocystis sp. BT1]
MDQVEAIRECERSLDELLKKYQALLKEMELASENGSSQKYQTVCTRFHDVYKEFSNSYRLAKINASRKTTRIELFAGHADEDNSADSETQSLLKEMRASTNSLRMADSYLEVALSSQENLRQQNQRLQKSRNSMATIGSRFPLIQSLSNSIRNKRLCDNIITAVFIAICVFFCIWYAFH